MSASPQLETALAARHSWVGGREVVGRAGTRVATSPATAEPLAEVSLLDREQAAAAIEAARAAFRSWSRTSFREREKWLDRLRAALLDEAQGVAGLIEREQGKPVAEAYTAEILPTLGYIRHLARHAEELLRDDVPEPRELLLAHKDARIAYAPIGVVLVITPWNYPLGLALPILVTALLAGNTVVFKPAPATTLVGLGIGALLSRAALPEGIVNVVAVDDAVAASLVEDPRIGKIVFTGSVATGKQVMAAAARNLTPVLLELGGKDPAIVCRDADLDRAASGIVWGAFMNAGQTCCSVERVYVERPVAEPFLERVVRKTRGLRVGDPTRADVEVGPMTLARQRRIVEEHVADARARGARVLTGGETPAGPGLFYPPTVLADVDHSMRIMREETFGPVLPVMAVDSLEEAIALANDCDYGLTASGWTRSEETAARLQRELVAGVVSINDHASSFGEPTAPWGGVRQSGIGRTHGVAGLREMVQPKYLSVDRGRAEPIWWYPYGEDLRALVAATGPALHGRSLFGRIRAQLGLLRHRRLWSRFGPLRLLRNLDKLV